MSLDTFISNSLDERKRAGLFRSLRIIEGPQADRVRISGKEYINLCSNNYLGLTNDPRLKQAATQAANKFGTGSAASRLICGSLSLHKELEELLADFKHTSSCLVFNSGYVANLGIISTLLDRDDLILSDRLNHASIVDAIVLSRARFQRYAHNDMGHLEELLKKDKTLKKKLIVTDSVFSMDGDLANLKEISELASRYHASVMVDEAHATGVLGPNGAGLAEELGLCEKIDIQMATLSKAVASFGAFVCGSKNLIEYLINTSRPFIYTTSLPPASLAASIKAIEIIREEPQRRQRLWDNINFMKQGLGKIGLDSLNSHSAIIPILTRENKLTMEFSKKLFAKGIFIGGIRPPTVPLGEARLRLTVTATHLKSDLEQALEAIKDIAKNLKII